MSKNTVYHLQGKFGIAFQEAVKNNTLAEGPKAIFNALKKAGLQCEGQALHNNTFYISVDASGLADGAPVTPEFVQKIKDSGGRFAGHPMAHFLNLKVVAPQPA